MLRVMQILTVFLDLGETLVSFTDDYYREAVRRIASVRGKSVDTPEEMDAAISELKAAVREEWRVRNGEDIHGITTDATEHQYWFKFYKSVLQRLGISTNQPALLTFLACKAADPRSFTCFPEVRQTLENLAEEGVKLGIISNAFPSACKILDYLKLADLFEHVVLSYSYGGRSAKPKPEIYEYALRTAGSRARHAVFVDDRESFVRGAQKIGMRAVLIDRENRQPEWSGPRIGSLSEIPSVAKHQGSRRGLSTAWLQDKVAK